LAITKEKLRVIYESGEKFVREELLRGASYDAVIIDCTDFEYEGSAAFSLVTDEFYQDLKQLLVPSGGFIQQISVKNNMETFRAQFEKLGFGRIEFAEVMQPIYGETIPLCCVHK